MPIKLIGKSILGDLGFSQNVSTMGANYYKQLEKIRNLYSSDAKIVTTSITGFAEREATKSKYFPKIREYSEDVSSMFDPNEIYKHCIKGTDKFRPGCDFIVWDSNKGNITALTFSREAPILAFMSSTTGKKALGTILRPSLMEYGYYLFSTIKEALGGKVLVTLVTCNHFKYSEGSILNIVQQLAIKHGMSCVIGYDSETEVECYKRGETGNHVVAMW